MQDPFAWSVSLGRLFGVQIKVHVLFPFFALGLILRRAYQTNPTPPDGAWIDAAILMGFLFLSILLHEFGHCFAARRVGGDATQVLLWPLGGLANVDLPPSPRAHFLTAAAGPATNLLLGGAALVALQFATEQRLQPGWNPFEYSGRDRFQQVTLHTWGGVEVPVAPYSAASLLAWFVWVNWALFAFNIVLVGFPMDSGRMLQSALWPFVGYQRATLWVVMLGFIVMFLVALFGIIYQETLALCLALLIYVSCKTQWLILENGGDESLFGYDFSQGYTSLERDLPPPQAARPRRPSWWQRWLQRRAARRIQQEEDTRVFEEKRMDELLEKVQREGITALTDEERRFMKRVSDRYRNRH